jgi:hypothetical protein
MRRKNTLQITYHKQTPLSLEYLIAIVSEAWNRLRYAPVIPILCDLLPSPPEELHPAESLPDISNER